MSDLRSIQQRRNADSRARWEQFASHRRRVTDGLLDAARRSSSVATLDPVHHADAAPRLCVLGAGNCNDLDLSQLAAAFSEVHLLDIDSDALNAAAARQSRETRERLRLHGDIDLSGLASCLARGDVAPEPWIEAIDSAPSPEVLNGAFDVVASVCTLTQILEVVLDSFDPAHSQFLPLVQSLRLRHIRQVLSGLKPGGHGVLITDVVSSETCPELPSLAEWQLPGLLQQLIATRNFFTGVNPLILWQLLAAGVTPPRSIVAVEPLAPWLWDLGPRVYAVCGWIFEKGPAKAT